MNEIAFSVVIPLYNKELYIQRTIHSVLAQSHQNFEIIVVDDGSTDKSLQIVNSFNDERIKVVKQKNQGVSVARNTGIKEARHDFIALLDADDEWKKMYLEEISKAICNHPDYIAYATGHVRFKHGSNIYKPSIKFVPEKSGELKNYFKSCFWGNQVVTSSSVCLNKIVLEEINFVNLFPAGIKRGEDLDTWTRLNLKQNFYFINKPLVKIHYDHVSASNKPFYFDEAYKYHKWFLYKTDSFEKSLYLYLYTITRILKVFAKTIRLPQLKRRLLGQ